MRPFATSLATYRPFGRVFSVLRFFRAIGINHLLVSYEYLSIAEIISQAEVSNFSLNQDSVGSFI